SAPSPLPGSVPAALQAIVLRSLEKDPARRFRDGAELARALEMQPLAATIRPVDVTRPRRRHGRAELYAAAATLAVAAAVTSAFLVQSSASRNAPWWAREDDFRALERNFRNRHPRAEAPPTPPVPAAPGRHPPFESPVVPEVPSFDLTSIPGVPAAALRAADWAYVNGARALSGAEKTEQAERMLRRSIERRPGFVPARLELFALLRRRGHRGDANGLLHGAAETLPAGDWHATLVKAYRGEASDADVIKAASATADEEED